MKTNFVDGVSKDKVAALRERMKPRIAAFDALAAKVKSGKATAEEKAEYAALTKRARELDPNVLVD
ncbi:MAG: hypothetical protein QM680_09760 [Luteolibacter sp.]